MVYILNGLPQNISGSTTSGTKYLYFTRNTVTNPSYTYYYFGNVYSKMVFSTAVDFKVTYSYSIGDHEGNDLPMSAMASTDGDIVFFYLDGNQGYVSKRVRYPEGIAPSEWDQFANIGMRMFAILKNDSHYFYTCDLTGETTFQKVPDVFNTMDGSDGGADSNYSQLGVLFQHTLVSMGGSQGGLRFFFWDGNSLNYLQNYTESKWAPYGVGCCQVIRSNQIFGAGCTYTGGSLLNVRYLCTEDTTNHQVTVKNYVELMTTSDASTLAKPIYTDLYLSTCSLFQDQLHFLQTSSTSIYPYSCSYGSSYNSGSYAWITSFSPTILFAYDTSNRSLVRITIQDNVSISKSNVYTPGEHSLCCKIPGIPAVYSDVDTTQADQKPRIDFTTLEYQPMYLPEGSTLNETVVQEYQILFPKKANVFTMQVSSNSMNHRICSDVGNGKGYFL